MKVNVTPNFFLKQFLPIESDNCTILIVQSLAQGLLSKIPGGGEQLEGEGGGKDAEGAAGGAAGGSRRGQVSLARENGPSLSKKL